MPEINLTKCYRPSCFDDRCSNPPFLWATTEEEPSSAGDGFEPAKPPKGHRPKTATGGPVKAEPTGRPEGRLDGSGHGHRRLDIGAGAAGSWPPLALAQHRMARYRMARA